MNELTKIDKDIVYSGFKFKKNGLEAIGLPTFDNWQECGEFIKKAEGAVNFWLGDWIRYGEGHYGEMYTQALEESGYSLGTLQNDKYVAGQIESSRRREDLTFDHHQTVAGLEVEDQEKLLNLAEDKKIKTNDFRKLVKKFKTDKAIKARANNLPTFTDDRLINGDCLDNLDKLENKSVDLLLTDPPYGMLFDSGWSDREKIKNDGEEEAKDLLDKMLVKIKPKLKDNFHAYIFGNHRLIPEFSEIIGKHLKIKDILVWDREVIGMGDLDSYGESYDVIYFCVGDVKRDLAGKRERNIIRIPRVSPDKLLHPTEKPLSLTDYLVMKSTVEGELVVDPFMGSGGSLVSASRFKRKYFGCELEKEYYDIAVNRINGNN